MQTLRERVGPRWLSGAVGVASSRNETLRERNEKTTTQGIFIPGNHLSS
jgi:hypothetical protein